VAVRAETGPDAVPFGPPDEAFAVAAGTPWAASRADASLMRSPRDFAQPVQSCVAQSGGAPVD
jgi:hypothetical protein